MWPGWGAVGSGANDRVVLAVGHLRYALHICISSSYIEVEVGICYPHFKQMNHIVHQ
jgi:hypothetical protein